MNKIFITKNDHKKLTDLISEKWPPDDYVKALLSELNRAEIKEPKKIPRDVITMNSQVSLVDIDSGEKLVYWLVFPRDGDVGKNKISVLSPIGCALLGYHASDIITLKVPNGERKLRVEKILHQPEAAGHYE